MMSVGKVHPFGLKFFLFIHFLSEIEQIIG